MEENLQFEQKWIQSFVIPILISGLDFFLLLLFPLFFLGVLSAVPLGFNPGSASPIPLDRAMDQLTCLKVRGPRVALRVQAKPTLFIVGG